MTLPALVFALFLCAGQALPQSGERPGGLVNLTKFFDSAVEDQMASASLPGVLVVLVEGKEVRFMKGYGMADIEAQRAFDPERTIIRAASVSKLFTATAVMQLVEQGLIDLDADVNTYLDFRIPDTFAEPITLRHLLTHTAGFDERLLGMDTPDPKRLLSLREHVTDVALPRVRPPGRTITYSNFGIELAGYIVERVSGMSFADYVAAHIFEPLGMYRSTFMEPPPERFRPDVAGEYMYRNGRFERFPQVYINGAPSGGIYATADDMARFMAAHLNEGSLDGRRILAERSAREMHERAFTHHPRLPGWALGFFEEFRNGRRIIAHGGDWAGAHSFLVLVPQEHVGLFVFHNGEPPMTATGDPRIVISNRFLDTFFPPDDVVHTTAETLLASVPAFERITDTRVAGNYRITRYARTTAEKLLVPMSFMRVHVRENPNGTIKLSMPMGLIESADWREVEPLLFERIDTGELMAFERDGRGRISHMYTTFITPLAFERVAWYESEIMLLGLFAFSATAFVLAFLVWPVGYLARRFRRPLPEPVSLADRRAHWLTVAIGGVGSFVIVILGVMFAQAAETLDTPLLPVIPLLAGAVVVAGILSMALGYLAFRGDGPLIYRLGRMALAGAALVFVWQMSYWNVL